MRNGGTIVVSTFTAVLFLAVGCTSGGPNPPPAQPPLPAQAAKLSIAPANGTTKVPPTPRSASRSATARSPG
ncbi:hypothetical protein ACFQYP_02080 [Nonomuraea antimicrobica]